MYECINKYSGGIHTKVCPNECGNPESKGVDQSNKILT